jgi:hypothetical protein
MGDWVYCNGFGVKERCLGIPEWDGKKRVLETTRSF